MASSVPVLFVVLGYRKLRVHDLLYLLRIPFIEEVFFWLLPNLLPHVLFDALPRPVVVHARAEYVECAERFAVEFLPSQQIGNQSGLPAARVGQKQRSHGQAGQVVRRTLPYLQLGIVLHGLHAQDAAHFKLYEVNTDSTSGPRALGLSLWSPLRTGTSRHSIES